VIEIVIVHGIEYATKSLHVKEGPDRAAGGRFVQDGAAGTSDDACKRPAQALLDPYGHSPARVAGQTIWEFKTMATGTNRILDDFARLMTDAAGAAQGVRKEVETAFHAQAERFLNNMDVVKREEFEAVREMAARARDENEALKARIEALEAKLSGQ
jgi:BMFP domain-containing protein YqiC